MWSPLLTVPSRPAGPCPLAYKLSEVTLAPEVIVELRTPFAYGAHRYIVDAGSVPEFLIVTVETPLKTPGSWFVNEKRAVQFALTLLFDSPVFDSQTGLAFTVFCRSSEPELSVEFAFVVWAVKPAKVPAPPK